jgi:hypothetical protein
LWCAFATHGGPTSGRVVFRGLLWVIWPWRDVEICAPLGGMLSRIARFFLRLGLELGPWLRSRLSEGRSSPPMLVETVRVDRTARWITLVINGRGFRMRASYAYEIARALGVEAARASGYGGEDSRTVSDRPPALLTGEVED